MRERAELLLKILCGVLLAVLASQVVGAVKRSHPFAQATIPAVPTLAADTNASPGSAAVTNADLAKASGTEATNAPVGTNQTGTNLMAKLVATNAPATTNQGTNRPALVAGEKVSTNAPESTNSVASSNALASLEAASTNQTAQTHAGPQATNALAASKTSSATNGAVPTNGAPPPAGQLAGKHSRRLHAGMPSMMGMGFFPGMGGPGKPLPELPAVDKARIDKIVESELLGPVMHPIPMGLLGIAGDDAFLRAGTGETGLVKVGDTLGDLKLLKIGMNRVLVEQNGQKQELTIFDGMGSESLLNISDTTNSNETIQH